MTDYLSNQIDCELVLGVVCAVGTEKKPVIEQFSKRLEEAGYSVQVVKMTKDVIPLLEAVPDCGQDQFRRISSLMDAGNESRRKASDKAKTIFDDQATANRQGYSVLALGAAVEIFKRRTESAGERAEPLPKTAFIIDSLKRPEEVDQLRRIYPSGFVLVGIHADKSDRKKYLTNELKVTDENANGLIQRDERESNVPHGQRLNDTFHLADCFVEVSDSREKMKCDIKRIVDLLFGNPFLTPTFDEYAMFLAFAASLRSADLARQVGAVITNGDRILSTAANECPKYGGGLYWPKRPDGKYCIEDFHRGRDFTRGCDSNSVEQMNIINSIIDEAKESGVVDGETEGALRDVLMNSRIDDLTEFGRVVHAEMEAILCCGRNGISTVGATLYCTTFPCHNCAKHIVAAGLDRVVYVEPYPKSMALTLHDDSIVATSTSAEKTEGLVRFEPFVGIGPRRFFDLFSMRLSSGYDLIRKVKESGAKKEWLIGSAKPRLQMKPADYLELEAIAGGLFDDIANRIPDGGGQG